MSANLGFIAGALATLPMGLLPFTELWPGSGLTKQGRCGVNATVRHSQSCPRLSLTYQITKWKSEIKKRIVSTSAEVNDKVEKQTCAEEEDLKEIQTSILPAYPFAKELQQNFVRTD